MFKRLQDAFKSINDGADNRARTILLLIAAIITLRVLMPKLSSKKRKKLRSDLIDSVISYFSQSRGNINV